MFRSTGGFICLFFYENLTGWYSHVPFKPFEMKNLFCFFHYKPIFIPVNETVQVEIKTLLGISLPILSVSHPQLLSALPSSPPFPPQLALKGWESRRWHIMLPVWLLWGCVCVGKVTRQKDHQAGVGGGGAVPFHSGLLAMSGKSLVCMTGFQGAIAFCLGFFHCCCNGPWRATTKVELILWDSWGKALSARVTEPDQPLCSCSLKTASNCSGWSVCAMSRCGSGGSSDSCGLRSFVGWMLWKCSIYGMRAGMQGYSSTDLPQWLCFPKYFWDFQPDFYLQHLPLSLLSGWHFWEHSCV